MAWRKLARLTLFASGDFAFNLYWQSLMLYLLFYYTEYLHLGIVAASTIFLIASVWDGVFSFGVGIVVDRPGNSVRYRQTIMLGAVPLSLGFVAAYLAVPMTGAGGIALIFSGHVLFRSMYALVNIPYLAMSARISAQSGDRGFVAGMRMLAGTLAAVVVVLGTRPIGHWLTGGQGPAAFTWAAVIFASLATANLIVVGLSFREGAIPIDRREHRHTVPQALAAVLHNRAFVTLAAAMMAMTVAVTVLNKSVLYYYKYNLGTPSAGQWALAAMMALGGAAVPVWMLASRWVGVRALWVVASGLSIIGLAVFLAFGFDRPGSMQLFLMAMQVCTVGLNFAGWAMLPDTIEYGQKMTGLRIEGGLYGMATLLQRIAIGCGTALMGLSFAHAGFNGAPHPSVAALTGIRLTIGVIPILFLALSALLMVLNPLHRHTHDAIVRELTD